MVCACARGRTGHAHEACSRRHVAGHMLQDTRRRHAAGGMFCRTHVATGHMLLQDTCCKTRRRRIAGGMLQAARRTRAGLDGVEEAPVRTASIISYIPLHHMTTGLDGVEEARADRVAHDVRLLDAAHAQPEPPAAPRPQRAERGEHLARRDDDR